MQNEKLLYDCQHAMFRQLRYWQCRAGDHALISRTETGNRAYMLFTPVINCETVFYSLVAACQQIERVKLNAQCYALKAELNVCLCIRCVSSRSGYNLRTL